MTTGVITIVGDGYNLSVTPEAEQRKAELLALAANVTTVDDNEQSFLAQHQVRNLAAMRIAVEKSRKDVKEPINRISKLIDETAKNFIGPVVEEEDRIKALVGKHAEEVARQKAEAERIEREAFEAARAAREAAEDGGIAAVIAAKKAAAERLAASDAVAETNVAAGVRFVWGFEVDDMKLLASIKPDFVEMIARRSVILAWIKSLDDGEVEDVAMHCFAAGIRAFKKPVVSSR
jgi:hypothetical protein